MKRAVLRTPAFTRDLRSWLNAHPADAQLLEDVLAQMSEDLAAPKLRMHKLRGPLAGCYACSAGYDIRIVFELVQHQSAEAILLLALGTHEDVY